MCFVCLVGSSEDGLRLRLRLSSVPGHARPAVPSPFALLSSVKTSASEGELVIVVYNIRRGGVVLATKWSPWA